MFTSEFPPIIGGIGTYTIQLALAAHKIGHDVTVVGPEFGDDLYESDKKTYPFNVIRYRLKRSWLTNLPSLLWHTWRITKLSKFDVIHAIDWPYFVTLALLSKIIRITFMTTVYGTEILRVFRIKKTKQKIEQLLFRTPQHVFAISEYTKSLLLKYCPGYSRENISITLLGIDPNRFGNDDVSRDIKQTYSIPADHKIIVTVSRLDERKGHITVLKALRNLPVEVKRKITYLIIGEYVVGGTTNISYVKDIRQLADDSGVNVIFTGIVSDDELKSIYAISDVYCMPGEPHPLKVEGFGLVYLEAAAQGVPSIASRIGGVPEVVLHEKTGLLIEPGDVSGMVQALTRLLTDKPYRNNLGDAARDYARTFTWERCAEQTYGL